KSGPMHSAADAAAQAAAQQDAEVQSAPAPGDATGGGYGRPPAAPFNADVPAFGADARPEPNPPYREADAIAARAAARQDAELQAVARTMGFAEGGAAP